MSIEALVAHSWSRRSRGLRALITSIRSEPSGIQQNLHRLGAPPFKRPKVSAEA